MPKAPKCELCGSRHYSTQPHAGAKAMGGITLDLPRFEASPTALNLPADLGFEDWAALGDQLGRMERSVMWWIGDWWRFGERKWGERAAAAARSGRWSFQTFMNAGSVAGRVETSRRREVLSWSHHETVAALPAAEQDRFLDLAEVGEPRRAGGEPEPWTRERLRAEVSRFKTGERIGRAAGEAEPLAEIGEYQVLYADPPWEYEHSEETRAIPNKYATLSLDEIKALSPPAAPDSVLFLWATSPKLEEALGVMNAWGFDYRTCFVWVKGSVEHPTVGMGYYGRQAHELLLIGKRGDLPVPAPENRPVSVFAAPRGEHSEKPAVVYEMIERMYPDFSRVELFARSAREGWRAWGDQA